MSSCNPADISVRSELLDLTECPICCVRFERPLQLNCGHSFCSSCVDRLRMDQVFVLPVELFVYNNLTPETEIFKLRGTSKESYPAAEVNEARPPDFRNGNFPEAMRRFGFAYLDRAPDGAYMPPDVWPPPPPRIPPPPIMYPGLGGVPRPVLRFDEDFVPPPHLNRTERANNEVTIKCPECRQLTKVPPGGLPVNYRLQELVARVSETASASSVSVSDTEGSRLLKCLACSDVMAKGVYLSCRSCAGESETAKQLCSMCCLRSHNGHDIEEKRFLTVNDIVAGKESVSEATGRGYQAVDRATQLLDELISGARDHFQDEFWCQYTNFQALVITTDLLQAFFVKAIMEHLFLATTHRSRTILHAFEVVAGEMQIEQLSSHDELDKKIKIALDISQNLEELPNAVKDVVDEFRAKLDDVMNQFADSAAVRAATESTRQLGESTSQSSIMTADSRTDLQRRITSPTIFRNVSRDFLRHPAMSAMSDRRNREIQVTNQRTLAMRNLRLRGRLNQDGPNEDPWEFDFERERRQRRREDLRSTLFDIEEQCLRRRQRALRSQREVPPIPPVPSTHTRHPKVERGRSNSIEIISPTPPSPPFDLEQQASRLTITPEKRFHRKQPKIEVEESPENEVGSSRMTAKHKRESEQAGEDTTTSSTSSSPIDEMQPSTSQQSILLGERPAKRKLEGKKMVRFAVNADEPGPSFLTHFDEVTTEDIKCDEDEVAEDSDVQISEMTE